MGLFDKKKVEVDPGTPSWIMDMAKSLGGKINEGLAGYKPGEQYSGQFVAPQSAFETQGLGFLQRYMDQPMSDLYGAGKKNLMDTLDPNFDPAKSGYFKALRSNALIENQDMIDRTNRSTAAGGDFFSSDRINKIGDVNMRTTNFLNQSLQDLFQTQKDAALRYVLPYSQYEDGHNLNKATAGTTIGALPRTLQQAALEAKYGDYLRARKEQGDLLGEAQNLVRTGTQLKDPSYAYAPSTFERIMGPVSKIAGAAIGMSTGNPLAFLSSFMPSAGGGASAGGGGGAYSDLTGPLSYPGLNF